MECDLLDFLSQQKYVGISQALPKKIVNAMFNPLMDKVKALKTAVTQVPDQVSKMGTEINKAATSIMRVSNSSYYIVIMFIFRTILASKDLKLTSKELQLLWIWREMMRVFHFGLCYCLLTNCSRLTLGINGSEAGL